MKATTTCFALVIILSVFISVDGSDGFKYLGYKNCRKWSARRLFGEKNMLMKFLNTTGEVLKKKNTTDYTVDNWLWYFRRDLRSAFAVGTIYLRLMDQYNSKNTTKLTQDDHTVIQNAVKTLVNEYHNQDSFALWVGDDQGGSDPISLLGPPNNPDDVMSDIIYPTEKPDT
ncbi:uncharacterized protein LOC135845935 isoform X2 [Planococcus citri]|uniref:uncharacterized protein LOC135845935 isoform X2 n=1 Tax=Planococcus citri TaxID=170843 RepID=UPI0031F8E37D